MTIILLFFFNEQIFSFQSFLKFWKFFSTNPQSFSRRGANHIFKKGKLEILFLFYPSHFSLKNLSWTSPGQKLSLSFGRIFFLGSFSEEKNPCPCFVLKHLFVRGNYLEPCFKKKFVLLWISQFYLEVFFSHLESHPPLKRFGGCEGMFYYKNPKILSRAEN